MPLAWDELLACDPREFTLHTVPAMFAARGDAHAGIDDAAGSIEPLLALATRQEAEGAADAPWPPHFEKAAGEAPRVAPSRARVAARPPREKLPVITIARAKRKADAIAGLERWKARHPRIAAQLAPEHVLVDTNRGKSSAWYRVRINLKRIPEAERPPPEEPDPDYDWKIEFAGQDGEPADHPQGDGPGDAPTSDPTDGPTDGGARSR
jgi:bifunctional non-homologous end joining protein LigD